MTDLQAILVVAILASIIIGAWALSPPDLADNQDCALCGEPSGRDTVCGRCADKVW